MMHGESHGDQDQILLSSDLLNELSAANHDDGSETGYDDGCRTPSEPDAHMMMQMGQMGTGWNPSAEMLVAVDPWEWKIDAPEFVPGMAAPPAPRNQQMMRTGPSDTGSSQARNVSSMHGGHAGSNGSMSQVKAAFEFQMQQKEEKIKQIWNQLQKIEAESAKEKTDWENEKSRLLRMIDKISRLLDHHDMNSPAGRQVRGPNLGSAEASEPWADTQPGTLRQALNNASSSAKQGSGSQPPRGTLDSKMQRLNDLLHAESPEEGASTQQSPSIVSTLQEMFPHANVSVKDTKTQRPGTDGSQDIQSSRSDYSAKAATMEVESSTLEEELLRFSTKLESRAIRALQALPESEARLVLKQVDEMVRASGAAGRQARPDAHNVSTLLYNLAAARQAEMGAFDQEALSWQSPTGDATRSAGDSVSRFDQYRSEAHSTQDGQSHHAQSDKSSWGTDAQHHHYQADTQLGQHQRTSQSDSEEIKQSGDSRLSAPSRSLVDRVKGGNDRNGDYWTTARFDHLARHGAFDVKKTKDGLVLKIWMCELNAEFTYEAMQLYTRWLHQKVMWSLEEHNLRSSRQCSAEIDFSRSGLGDDAVGRLMQALKRLEVNVTHLKLFSNHIGAAGVHHICEFFRASSNVSSLQELHLSHNEIDDDACFELIQLLAQHPRYPLTRAQENGHDEYPSPIWLRLNNNVVREPVRVLQTVDRKFGSWICQAIDRHTCGPGKCVRQWDSDCPRVHLFTFKTQDQPRSDRGVSEDKGLLRHLKSKHSDGYDDDAGPSGNTASRNSSHAHDSGVRLTSSKAADYRDYTSNEGDKQHQWQSNQSWQSWGRSTDKRNKPVLKPNQNYQHLVNPKILQRGDSSRGGY